MVYNLRILLQIMNSSGYRLRRLHVFAPRREMHDARLAQRCQERGKLDECRANHPRHTTALLALMQQLDDLEDRAKLWNAARRHELRQSQSLRILKQIHLARTRKRPCLSALTDVT